MIAAPATAQTRLDSVRLDSVKIPHDAAFEARVREVASSLRCPVCQNNSIEESPSLLAQDMKREVRQRLAAGETPDEIRRYFISRYGEWVLTKPRAAGVNLSVWLLPVVALFGGAVIVWLAVRRWVRQGDAARVPVTAGPAGTPITAAMSAGASDASELRLRKARLQASLEELESEFSAGRLDARDLATLKERDEVELAAVSDALKRLKKETPDSTRSRSDVAPPPSGPSQPWRTRLGWGLGLAAFALILVLSLRGSVAARTEGGTITGTQVGNAAPIDMEIQKIGPLDSLRIGQLEAQVRQDSTNVPALIELGHLYLAQGMIEKAILVDTIAIHLQPDAPGTAEAFAHLGMILWSMGQTDGALKALDKAVFLRPELPEALLYRGIILFAGAQDMRAAAEAFDHYLAVAPPDANTGRIRAMREAARQASAGK
jgi:cytochrome c-type biogenesis protein CcmH/NrfF/cytochrome c-type biogenesis protein CcmH/NrfG